MHKAKFAASKFSRLGLASLPLEWHWNLALANRPARPQSESG
jgi:hypothetical protein